MPDIDPNPYSPLVSESNATEVAARWHITLAAVSFFLGFASFMFGVLGVVMMVLVSIASVAWMQSPDKATGEMLAGCVFCLVGAVWMIAGWLYLHRHYRSGVIANLVGISVAVVLIAIFGV